MRAPVTVIVPCFRGQGTLSRALDSVAAQSSPPEETLVVDDGNEPAVAAQLDEIARRYPDTRVLHLEQNAGLASARNAGWEEARARYVAFLDDDDGWHPRKLELQLAVMEAHPEVSLSATGLALQPQDAQTWSEPQLPLRVRAYPVRRSLIINPSQPSTWVFRQKAWRRFKPGWRHLEDHLLLLELLLDGETVLHLDCTLARVFADRFTSSGLTSQLWKMERAELAMYRDLHRSGRLGAAARLGLQGISLIKYLRRLALAKPARWRKHLGM